MKSALVVGSGPSAVHFARGALAKGWKVTMLDVGRQAPPAVRPEDGFLELKRKLDDPSEYFLGPEFEGVLFPGSADEYYGFPAHKLFIFEGLQGVDVRAKGFEPLSSYARGGLAEAWTGGSFPFNDAELASFPFGWDELAPHYADVAREIGVAGLDDDLARFVPVHDALAAPLDLDEHSAGLMQRYGRVRTHLNDKLGVWMGRTRAAVLRDALGDRPGCAHLGRCLWTCPQGSLYTPSMTLRALEREANFSYVPGRFVTHLELGDDGRPSELVARRLEGGGEERLRADRYVFAAGTLGSARLFLESLRRAGREAPRLSGLMDNRQVLMPFVNLSRIGAPWSAESYQYHQLSMGIEGERPEEYVHGLVTTLTTALVHPIVQGLPFDLSSSTWIFKNLHGALGLVNVNLHDTRREENSVELDPEGPDGRSRLAVNYSPPSDEPARQARAMGRVRKALWKLGCVVPPGMAHERPMGASVHYAGTLPMAREGGSLTTTPECESRDVSDLYLVDGTGFPFLPAKNLTFTLMANAARVAATAF